MVLCFVHIHTCIFYERQVKLERHVKHEFAFEISLNESCYWMIISDTFHITKLDWIVSFSYMSHANFNPKLKDFL